ncbi:MAG: tRNA 2-selenouridine synthase [Bacteroidia bacterium]|nr:tRNA 2-selenouridine synthase [Bacteroidia bacterium]
MSKVINIDQLLELRKSLPVLDVRSEGEYAHAHIPGAVSLPLLNNQEREKVGTCYKQKGREEAVLLGFDLVGHKFGNYIRNAKEILNEEFRMKNSSSPITGYLKPNTFILYCWRGGMRSNIMAWLLEKAGMNVYVLEGGYKTFRNWVLNSFEMPLQLLVVGGKTGSGKTDVLHQLKDSGEQVLDLEGLAQHRGSAFGGLGQAEQPATEQFENLIALELASYDKTKTLWVENESSKIGRVKIPDALYKKMREANVVEIDVPLNKRIENIIRDYAGFPKEQLAEATKKIESKLGNERMKNCLQYLEQNDYYNWVRLLMEYYDKAYLHGKSMRTPGTVFTIDIEANEVAGTAARVIDHVKINNITS